MSPPAALSDLPAEDENCGQQPEKQRWRRRPSTRIVYDEPPEDDAETASLSFHPHLRLLHDAPPHSNVPISTSSSSLSSSSSSSRVRCGSRHISGPPLPSKQLSKKACWGGACAPWKTRMPQAAFWQIAFLTTSG
eukprot:CAMPEP_0115310524 /NCGR_PEP_ID=MMETSP0270-20121206/74844_1 /TAXON_ID=71861 /ORGANISM="Scrippsiella trochoidea, Strain CCMP3099" /LENGTH=134 /DNA_ID=CAMNT_0002729287 /DNA_START=41 /DNA_END=441 /DNA_ORIENTATION=-